MYILAAKTLILCLAFAGVKMYQSKKIEEKLKREREEKLKTEAEKKGDWRVFSGIEFIRHSGVR